MKHVTKLLFRMFYEVLGVCFVAVIIICISAAVVRWLTH